MACSSCAEKRRIQQEKRRQKKSEEINTQAGSSMTLEEYRALLKGQDTLAKE